MRRFLKWLLVVVVLGEAYARGGRELLFGDTFDEPAGLDQFRLWIELPGGAQAPLGQTRIPVKRPDNVVCGVVIEVRERVGARDAAGYAAQRLEAHGEFERSMLGFPINVAMAQATEYTLRSLRVG